ncbi:MAG: DUF2868 domain-containing protein [Rhodospirillales bacterium]
MDGLSRRLPRGSAATADPPVRLRLGRSTILSERAYVTIARLLATPVEAIGFPVPDAAQITGSRWTQPGELFVGRERWGSLLGGPPRRLRHAAAGAGVADKLGSAAAGAGRYRLDMAMPGFARLQGRLVALARPVGVVDRDEPAAAEPEAALRPAAPIGGSGPGPGLPFSASEIEPGGRLAAAAIADIAWWDLGFAEDRAARHRIVRRCCRRPNSCRGRSSSSARWRRRPTAAPARFPRQPGAGESGASGPAGAASLARRGGAAHRRPAGRRLTRHHRRPRPRSRSRSALSPTAAAGWRSCWEAEAPPRRPRRDIWTPRLELIVAHAQRWTGEPVPRERAGAAQRAIAALWKPTAAAQAGAGCWRSAR